MPHSFHIIASINLKKDSFEHLFKKSISSFWNGAITNFQRFIIYNSNLVDDHENLLMAPAVL